MKITHQMKTTNGEVKTHRPTKCSDVHCHTLECKCLANLNWFVLQTDKRVKNVSLLEVVWTSSAGTSFDKSALKAGVCVGTKSPVTAPRYHQFLENWNCEGMYIIHYSEGDVEVCMKYVYEKYFRDGIEKVIGYGNCTQLGMEKTCLAQWKGWCWPRWGRSGQGWAGIWSLSSMQYVLSGDWGQLETMTTSDETKSVFQNLITWIIKKRQKT